MWKFCQKHPRIALCFGLIQVGALWGPIGMIRESYQYNPSGPDLLSLTFLFLGAIGPMMYFYPTFKAYRNRQQNFQAICLTNLLLGWTIIGWIVALVWAVTESGRLPLEPVITSAPSKADLWYEQNRKWVLPSLVAALLLAFYLVTHIS